jgi:hypothetical protein
MGILSFTDSATERSRFAQLLYSDTQALLVGSNMAQQAVTAAWTMQFAGSKSGMKVHPWASPGGELLLRNRDIK